MATKTKKKGTKTNRVATPVKHKSVSECTPRECIRGNRELRLHITVITILSVVVCMLVAALLLALLRD
jgi:hypothetical protein